MTNFVIILNIIWLSWWTSSKKQEIIECLTWHFSSYSHKEQFSTYIGQAIENKSYILLSYNVMND
jgi:hypothetical protein